ncbi:uncharacterized protein B0I36DRAFT_371543 [Microdochium trichocladiopsis]|uniref:SH3 domain-containing protein n=1 Tax=Microdochium trichocladiopsis TaxID=1682393 RepID=A0A9P8YJ05_9PEZI|nr:uncharacterized protein B0I36DRAFT_371543 [Microdochium trichocladiopsis]KAH7041269.1 hypothetical protein B0I36DRAFT_371543 [Microdochium trichocladiopsis]
MTRPHIVRADTIDLQDHDAPSAKDHSHAPSKPDINGHLAAHQAETLREVAEERAGEEMRSPRGSYAPHNDIGDLSQYAEDPEMDGPTVTNGKAQREDALAVAQNGGIVMDADDGHGDHGDDDDDDDMDDDMMDKISSSPSIEDGGCPRQQYPGTKRDGNDEVLRQEASLEPLSSIAKHGNNRLAPQPDNLRGLLDGRPEAHEFRILSKKIEPGDILSRGTTARLTEHDITASPQSTDGTDDECLTTCLDTVPSKDDDDDTVDDGSDDPFYDDLQFIDSGWGDKCLQLPEDIDFEFVYALHTFVATVEGQANATKGDTMVLLDDSNSYWWLVRVVKDSSIGYLPAEHIETPTERLARLNKHRNIDLSASMLGDTAEKTKNPLKTAMRRRKAKTVAFAAPTYVDYSDHDVSSDEGEEGEDGQQQGARQQAQAKQAQASSQQMAEDDMEEDESAKVEPLKPKAQQKQAKVDSATSDAGAASVTAATPDEPRGSEDIFEGRTERVTKNGTVRNTDSFFRDETIETKKITLTPGLLRDDTEPRGSSSSDSKEIRQRPSLDRFEKELVSDKDKSKDDKKRKDKKPSAIRSFFSRKDKKKTATDDDDESFGKRSMDVGGAEYAEEEPQDIESPEKGGPQRNPSKLQKQQPRTEVSPTRKQPNNVANAPPTSLRMVEPEPVEPAEINDTKDDKSKSAISKMLHTNNEPKPPKVTKAKARVELDDFDSSPEEDDVAEPSTAPPAPARQAPTPDEAKIRPTLPGSFPDSYIETPQAQRSDPLDTQQRSAANQYHADSAGVSPVNNPPALLGDTSSQEDRSSPISSPSPELDDIDALTHRNQDSTATTASTATNSTWNDANLRAFFDSGSDIRDMLVVVNDTTDVPPAGPDHPMVSGLFREQNAKLAEITTQLDNMLGDWLARKQRIRGTV